jgi:PAS domain S-box-containing protein
MPEDNFKKIQEAGEHLTSTLYKLQDSKWELENIIDNIPAFIALKDKHNNFIRVNKYHANFSNTTPDKMAGTNMDQWYTKEQSNKFYVDDLKVLKDGIQHSFIETVTNNAGLTRIVRTVKTPYKNIQGETVGVLVIAVDVSDVVPAKE